MTKVKVEDTEDFKKLKQIYENIKHFVEDNEQCYVLIKVTQDDIVPLMMTNQKLKGEPIWKKLCDF